MEREMRNGWFRFGQQWRQFDRKRSKKNKTRAFAFELLLVCSSCAFLFILEHYKQANTKGHTKRERKTWRMTRQCWAESGWLLLLGLLAFLPTPPPPHWTFCDVHCVLHDGRRPFCLYVVCVSSLDQHPLTSIIFLNDFNM